MPDKEAWVIRDVDEETRRKIKVFAAENRLTIAEALKALVAMAFAKFDELGEKGIVYIPNVNVTEEQIKQARTIEFSPEIMEAMREEVRRQLKQQREE